MFVPDVRGDGSYLRVTWHADDRMFVVSTWSGALCTAAIRIAVDDAPDLIALLAHGLGDATGPAAAAS